MIIFMAVINLRKDFYTKSRSITYTWNLNKAVSLFYMITSRRYQPLQNLSETEKMAITS